MIEMPLTLKMRAAPLPAEAFYLPTHTALFAACRQLRAAKWPAIHRLADGFLLVPDGVMVEDVPAAIRLRRLGGALFIPATADLLPALLGDEIVALTRSQGLVVLPDGIRSFDPKSRLTPKDLLQAPAISKRTWESFPARESRADRLTLIERPNDTPAAVIESLKQSQPKDDEPLAGPNETAPVPESARPPGGSVGQSIAAGATLGAAKFMAFAARIFKNPKLGELAGKLARNAVERVPRITEKLLGAQDAALRHLLKQLQSGDVEGALRRAPPAVADPDAPTVVGSNARLSTVDPRYSLSSLLGRGGGPVAAWLGGGDVWNQLAQQYRRLAEEALRRGDTRRAAYLYGVLLRDFRAAANALAGGGLHRDAAVILRDKLNDLSAAAKQFELAGDVDEAVRLYDRVGQYESAAEVLRRSRDDERAEHYYRRAAEQHAGNRRMVAAGDLVRTKLGDRAAAREYYRRGWTTGYETAACGERLFDEHVLAEDWPEVNRLLFEATTDILVPPNATEAGRFFNKVLTLRELLPEPLAENLTDTARCLYAEHLRSSAKAPHLAGQLFGESVWPAEVVRDAVYAARGVEKTPGRNGLHFELPFRPAEGTLVAAAVARESRDIVIATTKEVFCWRNAVNSMLPITSLTPAQEIRGISADAKAGMVWILFSTGDDLHLRCFALNTNGFEAQGHIQLEGKANHSGFRLQSTCFPWRGPFPAAVLLSPEGCQTYADSYMRPWTKLERDHPRLLIVQRDPRCAWIWNGSELECVDSSLISVGTTPFRIDSDTQFAYSNLDWQTEEFQLKLAVADLHGILHAIRATSSMEPHRVEIANRRSFIVEHAMIVAVSMIPGGGIVVATDDNKILRLRVGHSLIEACGETRFDSPQKIRYLFAQSATEAVAVLSDASVVRVRIP